MRRVGLYTLGCKVSLYETEAISEAFSDAGYAIGSFFEPCDVYVINTCTVTAESDAKSRKYIRRAHRQNPDAVIIVVGCYSQRAPEEVSEIEGVSAVVGTQDKLSAVRLAERLLESRGEKIISVGSLEGAKFENMTVRSAARTRGYVKIEDGCECKCTYCAIAPARGPVRSKPKDEVISEVEGLYRGGTREVVLTGIETGSYGADFGEKYGLADLITELDGRGSCERIRLGSMAPELLSEKFITRVAGLPILVPHFHVSMQSGSSAVLRAMKRRYTREMAMDNIRRIRSLMPRVMLTADLMVGFPGESEEDFQETLSFVREARLLDAHVFAYSKRSGTPAATYAGQIPEEVKRERSARLIAEVAAVRREVLCEVVERGEILPCILETFTEGVFTGHSDSYIEVTCRGAKCLAGELVMLKPISHDGSVIFGEIVNQSLQ